LNIVAWPLEDGITEERLAARRRHGSGNPARSRPNQEIRGSPAKARLSRGAEVTATDRQPRPGNLGTSDTGITMLRHLLQKQVKTVEDSLDPMSVVQDTRANQKIPTDGWNTILRTADASTLEVGGA
jgi:hypothetical protein